jgi:hypothetical protein
LLLEQGLAPMWDRMLEQQGTTLNCSTELQESLHAARLRGAATYLLQRHGLDLVKNTLDKGSIVHAVIKGADIRERIYEEPGLRVATDIDVLVTDAEKIQAIRLLQAEGFEFCGDAANISHEATLTRGQLSIDLHWDILRPGRTRVPVVEKFLDERVDYGSHWGMSSEASLFLALVHPLFTKYLSAPQASLVRAVDLARLLSAKDYSMQDVVNLLRDTGLCTAGWITLTWLNILTEYQIENDVLAEIQLRHNLPYRLAEYPPLIQLGFTLAAHDKLADAVHALRQKYRMARQAPRQLQAIEASLS